MNGHRLLACVLMARKHHVTIPSCSFHGGYHWRSQRSHHTGALKKATPFPTSQKGRSEEVKELEILFGLEQIRHADSASDEISPLRNLMETQSKVSHQLCNCRSIMGCLRILVRFCSGLPPNTQLRVRVALQACNTLSCCFTFISYM